MNHYHYDVWIGKYLVAHGTVDAIDEIHAYYHVIPSELHEGLRYEYNTAPIKAMEITRVNNQGAALAASVIF